jgi:sec-independent protein translocase protein TatB
MFDISFTELMVIGAVALIVIGPERLPRVARTAGHLLGRLQRYVNNVKSDINREMNLEDLRRFEQTVKTQIQSVETTVTNEFRAVESGIENSIAPARPDALLGGLDEPAGSVAGASNAIPPASTAEATPPVDIPAQLSVPEMPVKQTNV